MRVTALEINDAGILAVRGDGTRFDSPGFALLDERGIVVGHDAQRRARLQPRLINHRFWDQLSTELIRTPARLTVSFSDLVSLHLASIWQHLSSDTDQLILAVPGCYSTAQLGLLLGISQQLGIPVGGVVESGVAATHADAGSRSCYLDIQLHKLTLTTFDSAGASPTCRSRAVEDCGLMALYERWQRLIRDEFIRATRFDPLYSAQSEQALFDLLPRWLSELGEHAPLEMALEGPDGRFHGIGLAREQLISVVADIYDRVNTLVAECTREGVTLVELSHRLGGLPGVCQAIDGTAKSIRVLAPGSAAQGALDHADAILYNGPTTFTDHLPSATSRRVPATQTPERPTHLLYGGFAYPLRTNAKNAVRLANGDRLSILYEDGVADSRCVLGVTAEYVTVFNHASSPVYLNGASVSKPTRLNIGDTLTFDDTPSELKLIAVMEES